MARQALGIGGECHRQDLDGHLAFEFGIEGPIYFAHAAAPNRGAGFVGAEGVTEDKRILLFRSNHGVSGSDGARVAVEASVELCLEQLKSDGAAGPRIARFPHFAQVPGTRGIEVSVIVPCGAAADLKSTSSRR